MPYIVIREHKNNSLNVIKFSNTDSPSRVVEQWQKCSLYYELHKRLPGITWQIAESRDFVGAMIEGAKL